MSDNIVNGTGGEHHQHYQEIHQHYAEECSQDDIGTFLFTSESVGEGHPGTFVFFALENGLTWRLFIF